MKYTTIHPDLLKLLEEVELLSCFKNAAQKYALRGISIKWYRCDNLLKEFEEYKKQNNYEWQIKYNYLEARHREALEKLCSKE